MKAEVNNDGFSISINEPIGLLGYNQGAAIVIMKTHQKNDVKVVSRTEEFFNKNLS